MVGEVVVVVPKGSFSFGTLLGNTAKLGTISRKISHLSTKTKTSSGDGGCGGCGGGSDSSSSSSSSGSSSPLSGQTIKVSRNALQIRCPPITQPIASQD